MPSFTLNTRKGPVSFSTELEWDQALQLAAQAGANGNSFAADLVAKSARLSSTQQAWVYKIAHDLSVPASAPHLIACENLFAAMIEAKVNGLKKPMIRLSGPNNETVTIKYMKAGKMAGGCWVTVDSELAGCINSDGDFAIIRNGPTWLYDLMIKADGNVLESLTEYGKLSGQCSCCGLPLSNELSVRLGIGPICRTKYGF
jgi:hypothetical protein